MRRKERQRFVKKAIALLLSLGARQDDGEPYRFTLETKAGCLRLHPDEHRITGLGTVFTRFDDPQAARQLVECNPYSGKWNFHFFDGWTVETALADLTYRLRKVLT